MTSQVVHTTEIADVVADFEADEIKDKLDEAMDKAVQSLLECGQLAVSKLVRLLPNDRCDAPTTSVVNTGSYRQNL